MNVAYVVVTVLAAVATGYAASNDFTRPDWLMENMKRLNVSRSWLAALSVLKAAGALGLLAGIASPKVGIVAGACLVVFFVGAIAVTLRARFYSHLPYPFVWLLLISGSLALRMMTA